MEFSGVVTGRCVGIGTCVRYMSSFVFVMGMVPKDDHYNCVIIV